MADLTGPFDPTRYLRRLGKGDYLEVKWRLVWLRTEHPDAAIETELMQLIDDPPMAIFRARVSIPGAGSATGWGQEEPKDFGDYLEKAETKALGRALAALGYGTQFTDDYGRDDEPAGGQGGEPRAAGRGTTARAKADTRRHPLERVNPEAPNTMARDVVGFGPPPPRPDAAFVRIMPDGKPLWKVGELAGSLVAQGDGPAYLESLIKCRDHGASYRTTTAAGAAWMCTSDAGTHFYKGAR